MYRPLFRTLLVTSLLAFTSIENSSFGQEADTKPPSTVSTSELRAKALQLLSEGKNQAAMEAAEAMLSLQNADSRTLRVAADVYLRSGESDFARKLFDQYVEAEPEQMPYMWQRGIALFFDGDFDAGAKQFEAHAKVNPHDVENAAWHFLCVAKASSPDVAKQKLLPAPGDPRPPMEEVLKMLSSGDQDAVHTRVDSMPADSRGRADARFYADLYLGLYADAMGQKEKAKEYMNRAAQDAPRHYMGDVARVYAQHLAQ